MHAFEDFSIICEDEMTIDFLIADCKLNGVHNCKRCRTHRPSGELGRCLNPDFKCLLVRHGASTSRRICFKDF